MSVQAISCALALRGVSASEKLLLLALANYADDRMRCWPSQARLAADTCLSDRTVRSLLAGLEERRLLSRVEQRRQDGSRSSDLITLHFSGEVTQQAEIISGGTEAASGGGEAISGGVRKPLPGGAEIASGLTTFEPSREPSEPSLPDRERARQDIRRMAIEAKEAAGDALASMAVCPGIASIAPLVSLLKAEPPCDWHADILPAIEQAAAWHRSRDGPGSMTTWTLAARKAVENRNRRLSPIPPPESTANVRQPAPARPDRRQTDYLDRLSRIDAAMAAAVEPASGRR